MAEERNTTKELTEAFKLFDSNGDGLITVGEMQEMKRIGRNMCDGEAKAVMSLADRDNNGLIDYEEFKLLWGIIIGDEDSEIREEFARFDLDSNGYISKGVISKC